MAKKKKSDISQSGEKETNSSLPKQDQPSVPESPSAKYYQSITTLPLNRYIDLVVNDNLNALTISGYPTQQELSQARDKIVQECADKSGNHEYQLYLNMFKQVNLLSCTLDQVHICVTQLGNVLLVPDERPEKAFYRDHWSKEVNKLLLTTFFFDFNNSETYKRNLQRCINRSKGIKLELDLKLARFESVKQKFETGKKPDEGYFQSILITLSDHCGYHLADSLITVFEFYERIKRCNDAARRGDRPVRRPK
jgi:hypothetical protein